MRSLNLFYIFICDIKLEKSRTKYGVTWNLLKYFFALFYEKILANPILKSFLQIFIKTSNKSFSPETFYSKIWAFFLKILVYDWLRFQPFHSVT